MHASLDWLGVGPLQAFSLIDAFLDRLGPEGTLLMPSYTWRGSMAHPPSGGILDIRYSPTVDGFIPEVFRRMPGTFRSLHYWVPICGKGRLVRELLNDQEHIIDPYGPGSTFANCLDYEVKLVGLGTSLNTSSLAHLVDYVLESEYPIKVFSECLVEGEIIDYEGRKIKSSSYFVRPEVIKSYATSRVFELSDVLQESLRRRNEGKAIRFSYPFRTYFEEALRIGRLSLSQGKLPPWLEKLKAYE